MQQRDKTHIGIFLMPVNLKSQTRVSFELKVGPSCARQNACHMLRLESVRDCLQAASEPDKDVTLVTARVGAKMFKPGNPNEWGIPELVNEAAVRQLETVRLVRASSVSCTSIL